MQFTKHNRALTLFKAMANTHRIAIISAIASAKGGRLSVNELALQLKLDQPRISDHLKLLRLQKLVAAEQQGTRMEYSIKDPAVLKLLAAVQ